MRIASEASKQQPTRNPRPAWRLGIYSDPIAATHAASRQVGFAKERNEPHVGPLYSAIAIFGHTGTIAVLPVDRAYENHFNDYYRDGNP